MTIWYKKLQKDVGRQASGVTNVPVSSANIGMNAADLMLMTKTKRRLIWERIT